MSNWPLPGGAVKSYADDQNFRALAQRGGEIEKRITEEGRNYGIVEALPASPTPSKGDVCRFKAATGVYWDLIYTEEATYPWAKIGGPSLAAKDAAGERATASATYQTTGAPTITLPAVKMELNVFFGTRFTFLSGAGEHFLGLFVNEVEKDFARSNAPAGGGFPLRNDALNLTAEASKVVALKYKVAGASTGTWYQMYLEVDPLRVG